jgi:hypothetical protein
VLTQDGAGELKTVTEHLAAFNDDTVNPSGKATGILSAAESNAKATNLNHRIKVLGTVGPRHRSPRRAATRPGACRTRG